MCALHLLISASFHSIRPGGEVFKQRLQTEQDAPSEQAFFGHFITTSEFTTHSFTCLE